MRDAALLCAKLVAVERGEAALLPAIQEYESAVLEYGSRRCAPPWRWPA